MPVDKRVVPGTLCNGTLLCLFCLERQKKKKKILKTFSERVKTSQIQRIKSKIGHHISNHKGENSLCIHKCKKLTCTFPTLFFYSALITFFYLGWLLSALFAAIFKHLEPYLGKSEAQYTLSKRMNQTS